MLMVMPMHKLIELISSKAPTPGGGSVAALNGSLGASLITKVCRLSIGFRGLEQYENELRVVLEKAENIGNELSDLVERDTTAFNHVMDAFKMVKDTEQKKSVRSTAIQEAFRKATEVPFEVARLCCALLELTVRISEKSNPSTISDLGVSVQCAYAGIVGALMNVDINILSIKDKVYVSRIHEEKRKMHCKANFLKQK